MHNLGFYDELYPELKKINIPPSLIKGVSDKNDFMTRPIIDAIAESAEILAPLNPSPEYFATLTTYGKAELLHFKAKVKLLPYMDKLGYDIRDKQLLFDYFQTNPIYDTFYLAHHLRVAGPLIENIESLGYAHWEIRDIIQNKPEPSEKDTEFVNFIKIAKSSERIVQLRLNKTHFAEIISGSAELADEFISFCNSDKAIGTPEQILESFDKHIEAMNSAELEKSSGELYLAAEYLKSLAPQAKKLGITSQELKDFIEEPRKPIFDSSPSHLGCVQNLAALIYNADNLLKFGYGKEFALRNSRNTAPEYLQKFISDLELAVENEALLRSVGYGECEEDFHRVIANGGVEKAIEFAQTKVSEPKAAGFERNGAASALKIS